MAGETASSNIGGFTALGAITAATSAWSGYKTSKHNAAMADIQWNFNKGMALENQKLSTFIQNKNKIALLDASREKELEIEVKEMQARSAAMVVQSAQGMEGGSAQQVLHAISREAEQEQSKRMVERDAALFENKMQGVQVQVQTRQQIGIRPIDATSGALYVGAGVAKMTDTFGTLYGPVKGEK